MNLSDQNLSQDLTELQQSFLEYVELSQTNPSMCILLFSGNTKKFSFNCVPIDMQIYADTADWKQAIPKEFHIKNPNLYRKFMMFLTKHFYVGIPVTFSKNVISKLVDSFNEKDEFVGFIRYSMGLTKGDMHDTKLIIWQSHRWMLEPFMENCLE
jgi:hypothetical protein